MVAVREGTADLTDKTGAVFEYPSSGPIDLDNTGPISSGVVGRCAFAPATRAFV